MSVYTISFYLKEEAHDCGCEGHDHDHHHHRDDYEIVGRIKELGAWAHFMPNAFLVKTEKSADEIMTQISSTVLSGDMIFVTEVNKNNVASLTPGVVEWIKS